jgi:hypothetical protein
MALQVRADFYLGGMSGTPVAALDQPVSMTQGDISDQGCWFSFYVVDTGVGAGALVKNDGTQFSYCYFTTEATDETAIGAITAPVEAGSRSVAWNSPSLCAGTSGSYSIIGNDLVHAKLNVDPGVCMFPPYVPLSKTNQAACSPTRVRSFCAF